MLTGSVNGWKRRGVLAVFFLSGVSALLYQVVWLKYLGLTFGNTVHAAATLIAVFLGGLGLGAFLFSRLRVQPLVAYAVVEALLGTFGAFSPNLFELIDRGYVAAFPAVHGNFAAMTLLRVVLSALILLPPTILMGGTLPLLVRWFTGDREGSGKAVSALYAVNTLGATAGVALAGFVLIARVGLLGTILVAALLNFALAIGSVLLLRRATAAAEEAATLTPAVPSAAAINRWLVLLASLLMGLGAIADEVFWSRILVLHLGSSVYAYSLMLFSFLIGIGIGSAIIERRIAHTDVVRTLAIIELALGVALALQVHLFAHFSNLLYRVAQAMMAIGVTSPFPTLLVCVSVAVVVPTALMGAAFPLTVRLYEMSTAEGETRAVGKVYLANTLGSIVGAFLAGFVLVRAIGSQNGLFAMAAINLTIGAWLLPRRRMVLLPAAIVAVAFVAAKPDQVILSAGLFTEERAPILVFREDVTATVTLRRVAGCCLSLELNGVNVAGTSGSLIGTQKLQGHIPLLLHPDPKRVLHIGFGSGGTAWSVSRHPVRDMTIAEISPEVLEVSHASFGAVNHGVLRDPRVRVEINDGRNYVLATREKFDVILSDSIHPRYAGNGSLYTKDYFELCRRRLNPNGIVSTWLPMYSLTTRNYLQIVRAFRDVFPNSTLWYVPNTPNAFTILIGRMEPGPIPFDRIASRWTPVVSGELSEIGMTSPVALLPALMLGPADVERITREIPPHTDDLPSVEYESGRVIDREGVWYQTFVLLARNMTSVGSAVRGGSIDVAALDRQRAALVTDHARRVREHP